LPYRRSLLWPPAQEQLVGERVLVPTHVRMAGLGAPELGGLGGDSLREELPQLACFSAFRGEEGGKITGRDEAVLGETVVIGEK